MIAYPRLHRRPVPAAAADTGLFADVSGATLSNLSLYNATISGTTIGFTGAPSVAGTFNGSITIQDTAGAQARP